MKANVLRTASLVLAVVAAGATGALAQGPGYGPGGGYGPGMMGGGYGPGMMGPGMMGGYGPGGYGPGMMGGSGPGGYGPGMMGGYGRGGGLFGLDLTDEQRDKIFAIQEENRQKNWPAMGQLRSEMFKLRRMYAAERVDANALAEQQKKVDELRRQMLKSRAEAHNQIQSVLTPEQRKQLRQNGPWWQSEADEE